MCLRASKRSGKEQQKFYYHYYFHYQIIDELFRSIVCSVVVVFDLMLQQQQQTLAAAANSNSYWLSSVSRSSKLKSTRPTKHYTTQYGHASRLGQVVGAFYRDTAKFIQFYLPLTCWLLRQASSPHSLLASVFFTFLFHSTKRFVGLIARYRLKLGQINGDEDDNGTSRRATIEGNFCELYHLHTKLARAEEVEFHSLPFPLICHLRNANLFARKVVARASERMSSSKTHAFDSKKSKISVTIRQLELLIHRRCRSESSQLFSQPIKCLESLFHFRGPLSSSVWITHQENSPRNPSIRARKQIPLALGQASSKIK